MLDLAPKEQVVFQKSGASEAFQKICPEYLEAYKDIFLDAQIIAPSRVASLLPRNLLRPFTIPHEAFAASPVSVPLPVPFIPCPETPPFPHLPSWLCGRPAAKGRFGTGEEGGGREEDKKTRGRTLQEKPHMLCLILHQFLGCFFKGTDQDCNLEIVV